MTANIINLECMPNYLTTRNKIAERRCGHDHLTFNFDEELVICRKCGREWRDYLTAAEEGHYAMLAKPAEG